MDKFWKIVEEYTVVLPFLWTMFLGMWGSSVSYLHEVVKGAQPFSWMVWLVRLHAGAFIGLVTALLCTSAGATMELTSVLASISGMMGRDALLPLEDRVRAMFKGKPHGR